jgi:uncharacterized membrane protein
MYLSDDTDDPQHSEETSSSEHSANEAESSEYGSDEEMKASPKPNDTEELSNVLQRARESDHSKGKAVSKQMVRWALDLGDMH